MITLTDSPLSYKRYCCKTNHVFGTHNRVLKSRLCHTVILCEILHLQITITIIFHSLIFRQWMAHCGNTRSMFINPGKQFLEHNVNPTKCSENSRSEIRALSGLQLRKFYKLACLLKENSAKTMQHSLYTYTTASL